MPIIIFLNKKSARTKIFLTKKFHLTFLIAESSNCQDSYTTYLKLSANQYKIHKKLHLFINKSYIDSDKWPHLSKKIWIQ